VAQTVVLFLAFALGDAPFPEPDNHETIGAHRVALGLAFRHRRSCAIACSCAAPRSAGPAKAMVARLSRLKPGRRWAPASLGIGGPKRLGLTVVAGHDLGGRTRRVRNQLVRPALVGTVLVWVPVTLYGVRYAALDRRRQAGCRNTNSH
jgi:hypothetical protein